MAPSFEPCVPRLDALSESLMPFDAFHITGTSLAFKNHHIDARLSDDELLDRYAFCSKSRDMASPLGARKKVFLADRYGGAGILRNGGSGRCGFDGEFQVKGIGRTPLVGRDVSASYSDGLLSLRDAVFEAAWGEIAQHLLPYGAVRAIGVIATGTAFTQHHGPIVQRGLLIREAAIRPAHFERAVYFTPSRRFLASAHPHDAQRTADALSRLPQILRQVFLLGEDLTTPHDLVTCGMSAFVERFATQMAAAKAKRMMHACLTSSNLALDGRWLDFGATTCLPLENFGADSDYAPFWSESDAVMQAMENLLFYATKYLDGFSAHCSSALRSISSAYVSRLSQESRHRFLLLTGIPQAILRLMPVNDVLASTLAGFVEALFHAGFKPPAEISDPAADSRVGAVFLILARYSATPSCPSRIAPYLGGHVLPEELLKAYQGVVAQANAIAQRHGISPSHLAMAIKVNALRFSKHPGFLYRPTLLKEIDECIEASSLRTSVTRLLQKIHDQTTALLSDCDGFNIVLWSDEAETLQFDFFAGEWRLFGAAKESKFLMQHFAPCIAETHTARQLRKHFGPCFLDSIA